MCVLFCGIVRALYSNSVIFAPAPVRSCETLLISNYSPLMGAVASKCRGHDHEYLLS